MMLWVGQSISEIGSAVTIVALPFAAIVILHATTFEVGLLAAAGTACFLFVALPAGLVVDRVAKRRLMIVCDASRMLLLGSVVVAAALGALTLIQLYAVAVLTGLATVFFDVAYQSYVPSLIERERLHDGNGKLGATQAFAQVAGPGLGGALFGLLRAGAMAADAISYGVSTVTLLLIRAREPRIDRSAKQAAVAAGRTGLAGLRTELFAGLAFVFRHPVLRKIAACTATANLFGSMSGALEILFLLRVLHAKPAEAGLRDPGRRAVGPAGQVDRVRQDHLVLGAGVRRDPDRHAAGRAGLAAGPVPGRDRRAQLHRGGLQHRPAQLPAADLPAGVARPDERGHALDRMGHASARRADRRRPGQRDRHPGDALGRCRRQLVGGAVGGLLTAAHDA
jgi:hypothetical protein